MERSSQLGWMDGPRLRHACGAAGSLAVFVALGGPLWAAEVKFPKERPRIAIDVPGDWAQATTDAGLEFTSPEKNSIVVVQIIGKDKALIEAWRKAAVGRLQAFGVDFAGKPKPPPVAPAPPAATASAPASPASGPAPATAAGPAPSTASNGSPPTNFAQDPQAFTFSGAPAVTEVGPKVSNDSFNIGSSGFEAPAGGETVGKSKLPTRTIKLRGTTMKGKEVDADLTIYTLPDKRLAVLMQESDPDDNRSVAIGKSMKLAK